MAVFYLWLCLTKKKISSQGSVRNRARADLEAAFSDALKDEEAEDRFAGGISTWNEMEWVGVKLETSEGSFSAVLASIFPNK